MTATPALVFRSLFLLTRRGRPHMAERNEAVAIGRSADRLDRQGHIALDSDPDGRIGAEKAGEDCREVLIAVHCRNSFVGGSPRR